MRLPARLRMKESRDFAAVRARGISQSGRYFVLALLRDEALSDFQFGLVTGKKLGGAVVRNRLRRQMREIIREHRSRIQPGYWLVTIARWRAPQADFDELKQDWKRLAKRAGLLLPQAPVSA